MTRFCEKRWLSTDTTQMSKFESGQTVGDEEASSITCSVHHPLTYLQLMFHFHDTHTLCYTPASRAY